MIKSLNEVKGRTLLGSGLTEELDKALAEFIEEVENDVDNGKTYFFDIDTAIDTFYEKYGGIPDNYMYYGGYSAFFYIINRMTKDQVREVVRNYHAGQDEFSGSSATSAVGDVLFDIYIADHINELQEISDYMTDMYDGNKSIKNRPNYESLRRNRRKR